MFLRDRDHALLTTLIQNCDDASSVLKSSAAATRL